MCTTCGAESSHLNPQECIKVLKGHLKEARSKFRACPCTCHRDRSREEHDSCTVCIRELVQEARFNALNEASYFVCSHCRESQRLSISEQISLEQTSKGWVHRLRSGESLDCPASQFHDLMLYI